MQKHSGIISSLPAGYEQTVAMYNDLLEAGLIKKPGPKLRHISDPPITGKINAPVRKTNQHFRAIGLTNRSMSLQCNHGK